MAVSSHGRLTAVSGSLLHRQRLPDETAMAARAAVCCKDYACKGMALRAAAMAADSGSCRAEIVGCRHGLQNMMRGRRVAAFTGDQTEATSRDHKGRSLKEALLALDAGDQQGVSMDPEFYASLLRTCIELKAVTEGERVHAHIISRRVEMSIYLQNTLMSMYVKFGKVEKALEVFDAMKLRTVVSWNTMIAGLAKHAHGANAFKLFEQMQAVGQAPDKITFISILKACMSPEWLEAGKKVHKTIVMCGLESDTDVANSLLEMYVKCGSTERANELLEKLPHPNDVSWNILIAAHVRKGQLETAVNLLERAGPRGLKSKVNIYVNILSACTDQTHLQYGVRVHSDLVKSGLQLDGVVGNCLIDMYGKCGSMQDAENVFRKMSKRDAITWTSLMAGYVRHGQNDKALDCFRQMEQTGVTPTRITFSTILKSFCSPAALEQGKRIHAQIADSGYESDAYLTTSLIQMYTKCGSIGLARQLFDRTAGRELVAWNMMLGGYAEHGLADEAWGLFQHMRVRGIIPDAVTFSSVLNSCFTPAHLERGKVVHTLILESGLGADTFLGNSLVSMYTKCGSLIDARNVFNDLPKRNVVSWNTMLNGYAKNRMTNEAFRLYAQMKQEGVPPDQATFTSILRACDSSSALKLGQQAHSEIQEHGVDLEGGLGESLIDMYVRCGSLEDAQRVFDGLGARGAFAWSLLIGEYAKQGLSEQAIGLFKRMTAEGGVPTTRSFLSMLSACNSPKWLEEGRQVHDMIIHHGCEADIFVSNALLAMYADCGGIEEARQYFDTSPVRDVVTWNKMIRQYVTHGDMDEAFRLFGLMESQGVTSDQVTLCTLLNGCSCPADQERGRVLHSLVRERGLDVDVYVANSVLAMYADCGLIHEAREVFDKMGERNLVTWNTMLGGYVKCGELDTAREFFTQMQEGGMKPDKVTFLWILQACTSAEALVMGRKVHQEIIKRGLLSDIMVGTSVVDMYSKCGSLVDAREVFEDMPEQDLILWNAMIGGYSENGDTTEALKTFQEMLDEGWKPDRWTFVHLLLGCTTPAALEHGKQIHALALERGYKYDVYVGSALVCMYSRCGSLDDAIAVFESIPDRDVVLWTAMMVVYAKHGYDRKAFDLFWEMDKKVVKPDVFLYVGILNLCANTAAIEDGKNVHALVINDGLLSDVSVGTALIDMYACCGHMDQARQVFNTVGAGDDESWKSVVAKYSRFRQTERLRPNVSETQST